MTFVLGLLVWLVIAAICLFGVATLVVWAATYRRGTR